MPADGATSSFWRNGSMRFTLSWHGTDERQLLNKSAGFKPARITNVSGFACYMRMPTVERCARKRSLQHGDKPIAAMDDDTGVSQCMPFATHQDTLLILEGPGSPSLLPFDSEHHWHRACEQCWQVCFMLLELTTFAVFWNEDSFQDVKLVSGEADALTCTSLSSLLPTDGRSHAAVYGNASNRNGWKAQSQ